MEALAGGESGENVNISVDGGEFKTIKAINLEYFNNVFISLKDICGLFIGTDAAFETGVGSSTIKIMTLNFLADVEKSADIEWNSDDAYNGSDCDFSGWSDEEIKAVSGDRTAVNPMFFNGEERRYFTAIKKFDDYNDCFISPVDLAMLFDINITMDENHNIMFDTAKPFVVDPDYLEKDGFFNGVNAVLVGDATTDEIYYSYDANTVYSIASTTKIMTALLVLEEINSGRLSYGDRLTISSNAANLSKTSDGVIPMKANDTASVDELLKGLLLASSNESAVVLAEGIAGSEEEFAHLMNARALELGMTTAEFINSNGLPVFTDEVIPSKKQNRMSAADMFKLTSYIMNNRPELTTITSLKKAELTGLKSEVNNSNPVLYNMPEVVGLKTGTTTRSGACLITALKVSDGNTEHDIIVVLFGAEGSQDRLRVSEILAHYGKNVVLGRSNAVENHASGESEDNDASLSARTIIRFVVNNAMRQQAEQK